MWRIILKDNFTLDDADDEVVSLEDLGDRYWSKFIIRDGTYAYDDYITGSDTALEYATRDEAHQVLVESITDNPILHEGYSYPTLEVKVDGKWLDEEFFTNFSNLVKVV